MDPASVVDLTGDLVVTEDGAPGRTHDFNPWTRGAGEWIGEGGLRGSHWRSLAG